MKFGAYLLLAVALLLPFRSALAAAGALCLPGTAEHAGVAVSDADHQHHHHGDGAGAAAGHVHESPTGNQGVPTVALALEGDRDASPSCSVCSAVCAASPLPRAVTIFASGTRATAERFPAFDAPHLKSAYGAPERPPRTA